MKNLLLKEKNYKESGWRIEIERASCPNNIRNDCDNLYKLCLSDFEYKEGCELELEQLSKDYIMSNYNVKKIYDIFEMGDRKNYHSILSLDNYNGRGQLVGYILLLQETFDKEYKNSTLENEDETLKKIAQAELRIYNFYVNYHVYNIIFYKDGINIDKAYDFYGININTNGMDYAIMEIIDDEKIANEFIETLSSESKKLEMTMLD